MSGSSILLVEDNQDDRALTLLALKKVQAAVEVVAIDDGAAALDYLFGTGSYAGRDTRLLPRLVLVDLHLPGVDGLEVLRRLRADERTRSLPVVIFSTSDEREDVEASRRLGASDYVRKPLGFGALKDVLQRVLQAWLPPNEGSPE